MTIRTIYRTAAFAFLVVCVGSCSKILDVKPQDVLDQTNVYQNVFDADAAIMGLYGKFMNLAPSYVMLNELRADLMTTTGSTDENLRQLNEHEVLEGNIYANPRPYYEVILNCNDIMANFNIMLANKTLKVADYNMRYSDVAALRCWVYLQLGIHFGNVPYVTDPLATTTDAKNIALMPKIDFNTLLANLIKTMEALPFMQAYPTTASVVTTVDGYSTGKFFINKQVLLGQLYLWAGSYHKAAVAYKSVMELGGTGDFYTNRISYESKGDNNDIAVGYIRYKEEDEASLVDNNSQGWRSIFARDPDKLFNAEWVWFLPFNENFTPQDPFINLFSNRGGSYLLKPSQVAMANWNSQTQKNNFSYDARGKVFSYRMLDGQPVIMKYLYNYLDGTTFLPVNLLTKKGKWHLYRAAALHLEFAEAANLDNHHALAYALVNQGLTTIPGQITNESNPYDFDARKSDNPKIAADWYQNAGIRGRAYLFSKPIVGDSTTGIEDQIINEAGLELAYEGKRWSDLLRVALRRNDPSYLANKVYAKLLAEGNPKAAAVQAKLMNKANWYLPFKWQ